MKRAVIFIFLILSLLLTPLTFAKEVYLERFRPPQGFYYPGDLVTGEIWFQNKETTTETYWVGYSLQDPTGKWYDVPAKEVTLAPMEIRESRLSWKVPQDTILTTGPYLAVMAIWDRVPHHEGALMLARAEAVNSCSIFHVLEDFSTFHSERWRKSGDRLGLTKLQPRNARVEDSLLKLIIPAGSLNGGGIQTQNLYLYGSYSISMQLPNAPSSITGFFLYKRPDFYHEIDIEIYNDCRGEIFFTTYARGGRTNTSTHSLGFDPTQNFHTYRFDFYPSGVTFYVDDQELVSFSEGLTSEPMYLMVNTWFPSWLEGSPPKEEVMTLIDWIRY